MDIIGHAADPRRIHLLRGVVGCDGPLRLRQAEDAEIDIGGSQAGEPAAADDAAEQVYAARVRRVADDIQLIRQEPRGEVAPLVRPQPRAATEDAP